MLYAFLAAVVIVLLLIAFAAFAIFRLQQTVTQNIRGKALDLISVYDALLAQKSDELKELKLEADALLWGSFNPQPAAEQSQAVPVPAHVSAPVAPSYRDTLLARNYRAVRESFSQNAGQVSRSVAIHTKDRPATAFLNAIPFETVYALSTLSSDRQLEILRQSLPPKQLALVMEYVKTQPQAFDIVRFWEELRFRALQEESMPAVHVSPGTDVRDVPKTYAIVEDKTLCEGVQIHSDGMLHDFAITVREIS